MMGIWQPASDLASGAHPGATFPNCHIIKPAVQPRAAASQAVLAGTVSWSSPQRGSPMEELMGAVREEDWERNFSQGLTKIQMSPEWSAGVERCSMLQWLVFSKKAHRALEVGSFCGTAALALAEALPAEGEVHAVEIDAFAVDFGRRFWLRSPAGKKIRHSIGAAKECLQRLAQEAEEGLVQPFDLAIIDADKENMRAYFDLLWQSPGLLEKNAIVCVDTTPFKGQPPSRYLKYGFPHRWEASSGQEEIDGLRKAVKASPALVAHEFGGLLIVQRACAEQ